jgi:hypothetical protein
MVATPSKKHARRLADAVAEALENSPQLESFFESHGRERFAIFALNELGHRIADRVILSIGFGRNQHGKVGSSFGQLNATDGRRSLANLLVSARRRNHHGFLLCCW